MLKKYFYLFVTNRIESNLGKVLQHTQMPVLCLWLRDRSDTPQRSEEFSG